MSLGCEPGASNSGGGTGAAACIKTVSVAAKHSLATQFVRLSSSPGRLTAGFYCGRGVGRGGKRGEARSQESMFIGKTSLCKCTREQVDRQVPHPQRARWLSRQNHGRSLSANVPRAVSQIASPPIAPDHARIGATHLDGHLLAEVAHEQDGTHEEPRGAEQVLSGKNDWVGGVGQLGLTGGKNKRDGQTRPAIAAMPLGSCCRSQSEGARTMVLSRFWGENSLSMISFTPMIAKMRSSV